ncbi:hypothetical protein CROQUDRAFT_659742 [Cronartium quercuum f. sp. fusiforme G11]|uniref:GH18 domain-containing protein n=1 Tax=Cronartium quercuum f. sp. fusiforme G11 TaxID=708437 RepID=A0A9P6NEP7_9BASI|nr:hypothetical protein CROQUDRAFT_659742 [Cronartium quercuum f. sp. fusiforme G11]
MILSRSLIFCFVLYQVLTDPEPDPPPPRYVALGETGTPVLNRLHRRQVEEGEEEGGEGEVKLYFTLSSLGKVFVHPTEQFPNITEAAAPDTKEASGQNSTTQERLSLADLNDIVPVDSVLKQVTTRLGVSSVGGILKRPTIGSYFPDWNLDVLSPEQVDYSKYDLINFAFAVPTEDFQLKFTQSDSLQTLDKLVRYGHGNGTRVCLSIGGWDGSKYFSTAVRNESSRETLVSNIMKLMKEHNLDGNIVDANDSSTLLLFFELLREKLGPSKIISAAVTDYVFLDSHGKPMTDVSAYGKVLDHILVMNYDYTGSSSAPGPNAPFANGCADGNQPQANMISAIAAWQLAGFPVDKILMGLPAYGYINWSSATKLVHKRHELAPVTHFEQYMAHAEKSHLIRRQNSDSNPDVDCHTNPSNNSTTGYTNGSKFGLDREVSPKASGNLKAYSGPQIQFNDLFKWGVLRLNTSNPDQLVAINGYTLDWDACSSTPYAFNQALQTVITFDDTKSIGIKSAYALKSGIGGVIFWDMTGDPHSILTNSARKMLGKL